MPSAALSSVSSVHDVSSSACAFAVAIARAHSPCEKPSPASASATKESKDEGAPPPEISAPARLYRLDDARQVEIAHQHNRELSAYRLDVKQLHEEIALRLVREAEHRYARVAHLHVGAALYLFADYRGGEQRLRRIDLDAEAGDVDYYAFLGNFGESASEKIYHSLIALHNISVVGVDRESRYRYR